MEDRGDGVLITVAGQIPATRLLGPWLVNVYEELRYENRRRRTPLRLRIGMHDGPVRHDHLGISGSTVNHACRLTDSAVARQLSDVEEADLLLVASQSLYEGVIRHGGRFIEPARYSSARLKLKQGAVTAWFHLPGRPAPDIPAALTQRTRPDELAAMVLDLTLLLEDVAELLEKGRYPEPASRMKIAGLLRAVADQLDVYGGETSSRDAVQKQSRFYDEGGGTHDSLVAGVVSACQELLGTAVAALNGVELPTGLTDMTIHGITPDTDSIVWDTVEEYEYGLVLGQVTVDAQIVLEAFMHKSDYSDTGDVELLWDVNDHMVEVGVERDAQLIFDGRLDLGNVELEFRGFNGPELHQHV